MPDTPACQLASDGDASNTQGTRVVHETKRRRIKRIKWLPEAIWFYALTHICTVTTPAFLTFSISDARSFLASRGEKPFRAKQLEEAVFRQQIRDFAELTTFSTDLRSALAGRYMTPCPFTVDQVLHAAAGDAHKAALRTVDGHLIESVLLQVKAPFWTVCVSSQIGCAMGCRFCATGTMGLTRNLTAMEICWQVLYWIRFLREQGNAETVTNVVYMGMGEPLTNMRAVTESLELLTTEAGMSPTRFAVSTSGVVPMIERFTTLVPRGVKLAISLHAPTDELRSSIVPVNDRFPLADLLRAARRYIDQTDGKVLFEYVVLKGINDQPQQAVDLARIMRPFGNRAHVNLINMNPVPGIPYDATSPERLTAFHAEIRAAGLVCTIRRDHGQDIMGACGQLVTIGKRQKSETLDNEGTPQDPPV